MDFLAESPTRRDPRAELTHLTPIMTRDVTWLACFAPERNIDTSTTFEESGATDDPTNLDGDPSICSSNGSSDSIESEDKCNPDEIPIPERNP